MAIPNIDSMTPEQARAYISSLAPTTRGTSGDYSDIDSFRSYTFSDPNYQFEDFRQLAEIAGYGKEDELASAMNISSGAGPDTFRIADPLDMGTDTGALSNLDDGVQLSPLNTTFEEDVLPANNVAATANLPVAQDLGEDGSPQPTPTTLYGSDYSLENLVGGQVERLYLKDPSTGKIYDYNYSENEFANNIAPPPDLQFDDLQLVKAIGRNRNDNTFGVDIDPTKYAFGGRNTPERSAQLTAEANREPGYEKGGGGLFYEYNNRTYYTPDNTGTSIPVGSTNIGRTTDSDLQLDKTFEGYVASGDVRDGVTYTSKGPPSASGKTMPPATDSFLESIGTNTPYNIGKALGLGDFILSSPPSNRFNLQPFFNQAESQGLDPFLKSQQRDTLQMIKDGNFFTALAGGVQADPNFQNIINGFTSIDELYPTLTGQEGLNEVLSQLQGLDDNDPTTGIDPSFEVDPFDTDSSSQVASISGDDEGTDPDEDPDADPETPEATDPFTVRAFKGGGLGPYATNYIFQRFGYRPQQTIDLNLTYDPVEKLYFFEDGSPVDPKFLENMQLTRLDEDGNVVYDEENNPVTMPRVVVNEDETTSEE